MLSDSCDGRRKVLNPELVGCLFKPKSLSLFLLETNFKGKKNPKIKILIPRL